MVEDELVVLLSPDGLPAGSAPKNVVHNRATRLHLAFSCHVVDAGGRLLMTRRALSKSTWPGVWTNSFCGHPAPDEEMTDAICRRAREELDLALEGIEWVLPEFRYRATDASGIVEHEICPVFSARAIGDPQPNPREVCEYVWADAASVRTAARLTPWAFSPWFVMQMTELGVRESQW